MALPLHSREIAQVVAELADRVRQIERPRQPAREGLVSTGHVSLDRLLSDGGLRRGSLVEWLAAGAADGAGTLAMLAAREAARTDGAIVVVDRRGLFYPPAAVRLGIDLETLIIVRPASTEDEAWAIDQVLRTRGVAAAWCAVDEQDDHTLRRWQLAAETSGTLGLLVRPECVRHDPSWAELRLLVEPIAQPRRARRNRRLRVTLLRSRAGQAGRSVELELATPEMPLDRQPRETDLRRDPHHETRLVPVAPPLAAAKARRRPRRA